MSQIVAFASGQQCHMPVVICPHVCPFGQNETPSPHSTASFGLSGTGGSGGVGSTQGTNGAGGGGGIGVGFGCGPGPGSGEGGGVGTGTASGLMTHGAHLAVAAISSASKSEQEKLPFFA